MKCACQKTDKIFTSILKTKNTPQIKRIQNQNKKKQVQLGLSKDISYVCIKAHKINIRSEVLIQISSVSYIQC